MFDSSYQLTFEDNETTDRYHPLEDTCIDLVELEWNTLKFEPDFFLANEGDEDDDGDDIDDEEDDDDEPQKVDYLMKIVEELQKENKQLRQKVEQLSTTNQ